MKLLAIHGSLFGFAVPQLGQFNNAGVCHWYPGLIIFHYLEIFAVIVTAFGRVNTYRATYFG
jgi:hypothetical protein